MSDQDISAEQVAAAVLGLDDSQPDEQELDAKQEAGEQDQGGAEQQVESQEEEAEKSQDEEAADASDTTGQADTAPADDSVVKWTTANGETYEAPVAELKAGYMRTADYTQKTQALADERKQAEQALIQRVKDVERYSQEFGQLASIGRQVKDHEAWLARARQNGNEDPAVVSQVQSDYLLLRQQHQDVQRALAAKRHQLTQQADAQRTQEFQQSAQAALEHLGKVIPEFSAEKHIPQLRDYGLKSGFTADELAQVTDKRQMEVLYKAQQWDALQAKKPEAVAKVKAAPPKTTKSGNSSAPPTQLERAQRQLKAKPDARSLGALIAASDFLK